MASSDPLSQPHLIGQGLVVVIVGVNLVKMNSSCWLPSLLNSIMITSEQSIKSLSLNFDNARFPIREANFAV